MSPLPPLPDVPGLDAYLRQDGDDVVLSVPLRDLRMQALLIIFLLPVAWLGIGFLVALGTGEEAGVVVGGALACLATAASTMAGLVMLLLAPRKARASIVRLRADRSFLLAGGAVLPAGQVQALRVGQPNPLMKWIGLIARTPTGDRTIIGRLPPSKGAMVTALGEYVGQALDMPVDTGAARTGLGMSPQATAAFCYIPLQGLWLIASLFCLVLAKDPQVRFAARQSLAYYTLTGLGLVLVLVPFLPFLALSSPDDRLQPLLAVVLVLVLGGLALLRLGVGVLATWKAWKGESWVIPGLGWLSRRWLPAEE